MQRLGNRGADRRSTARAAFASCQRNCCASSPRDQNNQTNFLAAAGFCGGWLFAGRRLLGRAWRFGRRRGTATDGAIRQDDGHLAGQQEERLVAFEGNYSDRAADTTYLGGAIRQAMDFGGSIHLRRRNHDVVQDLELEIARAGLGSKAHVSLLDRSEVTRCRGKGHFRIPAEKHGSAAGHDDAGIATHAGSHGVTCKEGGSALQSIPVYKDLSGAFDGANWIGSLGGNR